ncbi:MAG: thermonuclease family protein [Candidatus Pacearchaeota archaeon]
MDLIKRLIIFTTLILILALLSIYWPYITGKLVLNKEDTYYQKESAILKSVVDGDTIKVILNNKEEIIRLLGINTPEKKNPYSGEATNFLKQFENSSIELLRDKEDVDKYNRKLRYIFYNDRILNVEILENGFATSFMIKGLKYEEKLRIAEDFARNNKIGLWKESKDICAKCIKLIKLDPFEDYFIIKNICNFECDLKGWLVKDDANHFIKLSYLQAGQEQTFQSEKEIWNDNGDRFFMRDKNGDVVIFYEY